jgi:hypothetical protein
MDLWLIQGQHPPKPNSDAEKAWKEQNRAVPYEKLWLDIWHIGSMEASKSAVYVEDDTNCSIYPLDMDGTSKLLVLFGYFHS